MQRLIKWLGKQIFADRESAEKPLRQTGVRVMPRLAQPMHPTTESVDFNAALGGKIADGGPGKNVLIRNKYVREDTGTHETLKIIDDSILESPEEFGLDPDNSGRFERSKSWTSSRSRN